MDFHVDLNLPLEFLIGAIVILLLISALFSASETAFTAAQKARIHRLTESGSRR